MSAWHDDPTNKPIPDDSWLLRRFPELAMFVSRDAREEAFKVAKRETSLWACFTVAGLALGLGAFAKLVDWYAPLTAWGRIWDWVKVVIVVLPLLLSGGLVLWVCRRQIERSLRLQLTWLGQPVCIKCGYDLQGLTEPRCPECGTAFHPMLLKPPSPK